MISFLFLAYTLLILFYLPVYPGLFDSAEFILVGNSLGNSHPTGHIPWPFLGHLFSYVPFGSIPFRFNLLSGISLSLCLLPLILILRRMVQLIQDDSEKRKSSLFAIEFLLFLLFFHSSVTLQSTRTEIYPLFLLFTLTAFLLSIEGILRKEMRLLLSSALIWALSLLLQPVLAIGTFFILVFPFFFPAFRVFSFRKLLLIGSLLFPLLLYFPLRSIQNPVLNWGAPENLSLLVSYLTAKDFSVFFHSPFSPRAKEDWLSAVFFDVFPVSILILSSIGVYFFSRRSKSPWRLAFCGMILFSLLPFFLKDFHLQNPDAHAYLLVFSSFLFLFFCIFVWSLFSILPSRRIFISSFFGIVLISVLLVYPISSIEAGRMGAFSSPFVSSIISRLPPGSEVHLSSDHWLFPYWYYSFVEKRRPDTVPIGRGMVSASWYQNQVMDRHKGHPKRILFYEKGPFSSDVRSIHSKTPSILFERDWIPECRRLNSWNDPFGITRSLCSTIVMNYIHGVSNDPNTHLPILEAYLGMKPSKMKCEISKDISIPFILSFSIPNEFLVTNHYPESTLALLYLSCEMNQSFDLLFKKQKERHQPNPDVYILHSYQLLLNVGPQEALRALDLDHFRDARGKGLILLARAKLLLMMKNPNDAQQVLEKAKHFLGPISAIQDMEEFLRTKP